jgi:F-type H+-transporting ATPase subunit alpha
VDFYKYDYMGYVVSSRDGIITADCLFEVAYGELVLYFSSGKLIPGLVMNLEHSTVDSIIFGSEMEILPGDVVICSRELLSVPISEELLGCVIDSLGNRIDGGAPIIAEKFPIESRAPSIISRTSVNESLETGIKVIDSLVPIGHGQRELIIGDSKTGKTSIAIDTILNQKGTDCLCIYVAIGQKISSVARIVRTLTVKDCLNFTVIVSATAAETAAAQYIAPYTGCAIGEYFMRKGMNVLIVYDDLSKHAVAYRQLSLLLRRPPGREGYPGDVFYLHSRLLERAANLAAGGSLTALPIIETIQGDVSAYIPTNVISITDGQICLDLDLFAKGIRPAVSPGLSVSRVGSAAQCKSLKNLVAPLKLELAQFREVEDFTKLGFVLDDATAALVKRGSILTQLLIQNRFDPVSMDKQIIFLYSVLYNIIDGIDIKNVLFFERELYNFFEFSLFYEPMVYNLRKDIDSFLLDYILIEFFKGYKDILA